MQYLCKTHNLLCDCVCLAENCKQRIRCQICVKMHDHKFYLADNEKYKRMNDIKQQLGIKLEYIKNYKKSNVSNLKLNEYKDYLLKSFQNQEIYLNSKILEETVNFNLQMEKIKKHILDLIQYNRNLIITRWEENISESLKHYNCDQEIEKLKHYFIDVDASQILQIEKSIKFLYSDEHICRFNKQLDLLKQKISLQKKDNYQVIQWLEKQQLKSSNIMICPLENFKGWIQLYQNCPILHQNEDDLTIEKRDLNKNLSSLLQQQNNDLILKLKRKYQTYQNIYRISRYTNKRFATSGARAINIWNSVFLTPQKVYPVEYPTYGLTRFKQPTITRLIFGLANGQLAQINPVTDQINRFLAHDYTIRDIIQYDNNHFITGSQDWLIKVWAIKQDGTYQNKFAQLRNTLKGHSGKVYTLTKFGTSLLSAGIDGTIKLWDIMRDDYDQSFPQQKQIYNIKQIRNEMFATVGELREVRFWDYRKPKHPVIKYPTQNASNCLLRYDENIVIYNDKNTVKIIDIRNYKEILEQFSNGQQYDLAINHMQYLNENEIGMGGNDNFITTWKY